MMTFQWTVLLSFLQEYRFFINRVSIFSTLYESASLNKMSKFLKPGEKN